MSSWKKAAKSHQKVHRERHQPEYRKKFGLLEKKKDYRLRADEFHKNEEKLKFLHKKALNRNPDEFYHHMINLSVIDGELHDKEKPDEHTDEQIKLMQTQDLKYINMKRTIERNKIERLQSNLHMIDMANNVPNTHKFFIDGKEARNLDLAKHLDTHPDLLSRRTNRPRLKDLEKCSLPNFDEATLKNIQQQQQIGYQQLHKSIQREKELTVLQQKMYLKRCLKEKRKLKPQRIAAGTKDTAPIYKFKYERKK